MTPAPSRTRMRRESLLAMTSTPPRWAAWTMNTGIDMLAAPNRFGARVLKEQDNTSFSALILLPQAEEPAV